jgi:predicted amidohydrolase
MDSLRLVLVQLAASGSKEESARKISKLLEKAAKHKPDIVVLPEYSMFDPTGLRAEDIVNEAEPLDGPWSRFFAEHAERNGFYILYTMFERRPGYRKAFNTAVLVSPSGEQLLVYRKTHMFDILGYRESDLFEPGNELSRVIDVNGYRLGVAICFEIRFPEIFRSLALRGADVVVVPAGWYRGPVKEDQIRLLAAARAHENTLFVVVPVLYGDNFTGRSLVADPYGVIRLDAGPGEKVVAVELSKEELEEARRMLPLLRLRRPELYG